MRPQLLELLRDLAVTVTGRLPTADFGEQGFDLAAEGWGGEVALGLEVAAGGAAHGVEIIADDLADDGVGVEELGGVAAGANTPDHRRTSRSGNPASAMVGTSGRSVKRCALITARARTRPALSCSMTGGASAIAISTSPETTAARLAPLLL